MDIQSPQKRPAHGFTENLVSGNEVDDPGYGEVVPRDAAEIATTNNDRKRCRSDDVS